jgi:hypothetical protein
MMVTTTISGGALPIEKRCLNLKLPFYLPELNRFGMNFARISQTCLLSLALLVCNSEWLVAAPSPKKSPNFCQSWVHTQLFQRLNRINEAFSTPTRPDNASLLKELSIILQTAQQRNDPKLSEFVLQRLILRYTGHTRKSTLENMVAASQPQDKAAIFAIIDQALILVQKLDNRYLRSCSILNKGCQKSQNLKERA